MAIRFKPAKITLVCTVLSAAVGVFFINQYQTTIGHYQSEINRLNSDYQAKINRLDADNQYQIEKLKAEKNDIIAIQRQITTLKEVASRTADEHIKLNNTLSQYKTALSVYIPTLEYLADKYGDLAYVFNLNPDAPLEISASISGAKAKLNTALLIQHALPVGNVLDPKFKISSHFGARDIKNHPKASKNHGGIDFAAPIGTPVYAPSDGVVGLLRASEAKVGSGNFIRLNHSYGFSSSYSHLSKFNVKQDQLIRRGDLLGWTGNTGYTTGPHLHYEIVFNNKKINPINFINYRPGDDISLLEDIEHAPINDIIDIIRTTSIKSSLLLR